MNQFSRADSGYTLIEVAVALLLLSLIGLTVAGGVRFGTQVWARSDQEITTTNNTAMAQMVLRAAFASATPNLSAGFTSFNGRRDRASFDGPAPPAFGAGGIVHFEVSLLPSSGGTQISLTVSSLSGKATKKEAILADSELPLALSYLDASERIPAWLAVWRNRNRLPDAVRIDGLTPAANGDWPSLLVRLAIAQDATCEFDPVSMLCRRS